MPSLFSFLSGFGAWNWFILGAILFAVMVSSFVLLLHVPRVIAEPGSRAEWTMIVIALSISAAAWCAAGSLARNEVAEREGFEPSKGF